MLSRRCEQNRKAYGMKKEQIRDYTLRISQANASGLVVIIYELLLDCLADAVQAHQKQDVEQYVTHVKKARRYMGELIHGLNMQDEIARMLAKRYIFLHKELLTLERKPDIKKLEQMTEAIEDMQKHFIRIAREDREEPIMANTQKVYAGLTYGRTQLNETTLDYSGNRGYQV